MLATQHLRLREDLPWGSELLFHTKAVLSCRAPSFNYSCVCFPAACGLRQTPACLSAAQMRSALEVMRQVADLLDQALSRRTDPELALSYLQVLEQIRLLARRAASAADAQNCQACLGELLQRCPCRQAVIRLRPSFRAMMPPSGGGSPPLQRFRTYQHVFPAAKAAHPRFRHSGALGDVIYALPALAALTRRFGRHGADLLLRLDGAGCLTPNAVRALIPLLEVQPYIHEIKIWQGEQVDFDLDLYRQFPILGKGDITRWYQYAFPISYDTSQPWLQGITPDPQSRGALVIARALRRQAPGIDYGFLRRCPQVIFLGLEHEFAELQAVIPHARWQRTTDFLQAAQIIAAARLFIGSQSSLFAIAEALKVPRLLEVPLEEPTGIPSGPRAAVFCVQSCFEQLVADFWAATEGSVTSSTA